MLHRFHKHGGDRRPNFLKKTPMHASTQCVSQFFRVVHVRRDGFIKTLQPSMDVPNVAYNTHLWTKVLESLDVIDPGKATNLDPKSPEPLMGIGA